MELIPLTDLPGSKLLHDWVDGSPSLTSIIGLTEVERSYADARARSGAARSRLVALVRHSMRSVSLTEEQQQHVDALSDPRSVIVTTGQQVGLFGGPLYTILKIASAVTKAQALQQELQRPVVPLFWLEDNDHDAREAASAHILKPDNTIETVMAWDESHPRRPVADRTFSAQEIDVIRQVLPWFTGAFADEERARLEKIYVEGASWSDAFLSVLQPLLGAWGVIVVRASDVVATGMHAPLVLQDIAHPGAMARHVASTTERLAAAGYHGQAQAGDFGFFLLDDDGRQRLLLTDDGSIQAGSAMYTAEALSAIAQAEPWRFSPGVLMRPIVQDALLPTIACILGPSELAYHAQLADSYAWLGVARALPVLRHFATILDAKTQRLLSTVERSARFYMRPWDEVMADVTESLDTSLMPDHHATTQQIASIIAPWHQAAGSIDTSLHASVEAASAAMNKAFDALEGKFRSALRRKHAVEIDRHKALVASIYPMGITQERILANTHWFSRIGIVDLFQVVSVVMHCRSTQHVLVGLADVSQLE